MTDRETEEERAREVNEVISDAVHPWVIKHLLEYRCPGS